MHSNGFVMDVWRSKDQINLNVEFEKEPTRHVNLKDFDILVATIILNSHVFNISLN